MVDRGCENHYQAQAQRDMHVLMGRKIGPHGIRLREVVRTRTRSRRKYSHAFQSANGVLLLLTISRRIHAAHTDTLLA